MIAVRLLSAASLIAPKLATKKVEFDEIAKDLNSLMAFKSVLESWIVRLVPSESVMEEDSVRKYDSASEALEALRPTKLTLRVSCRIYSLNVSVSTPVFMSMENIVIEGPVVSGVNVLTGEALVGNTLSTLRPTIS